jgi:leader peptidase (prepilin peptidase)/N-methyltransferase
VSLIFFLAGLPFAFLAERAIALLTEQAEAGADPDDDASAEERTLPWQKGDWPARVRVAVVLPAPVLMAIAGARFEAPQAFAVSLLILALLVCTGTDLILYRVPNVVTYPGIGLALAAALLMPDGNVAGAVVSAAVGAGLFLIMAVVTRGGIGLGDVKLAALIGAALGFPATYQALVLGVMAGGLVILVLFLLGVVSRRQGVPYAPFLALAAAGVVLAEGAAFAPL